MASYDFKNSFNAEDLMNISLTALGAKLTPEEVTRLTKCKRYWNFYEGYHWNEVESQDKPEVTENYCRAFVNKFVAFEMGEGFTIKLHPDTEETITPFLDEVWGAKGNDRAIICNEIGQMKSVTGDCWVQVSFTPKYLENGELNPYLDDPYNEYEKGVIRILPLPSTICFPNYDDGFDKDKLLSFTILYPIRENPNDRGSLKRILYRQVWTKDSVQIYKGQDLMGTYKNKYGIIPFFNFKNYGIAGRADGISDLEDVIPMNVELNIKKSDVSEVIDYHSAPVTVVYGAKIGNLEKGANKVWGGLPKDGKVENLELKGELGASVNYTDRLKTAMHEVGGVPEVALGKEVSISNTSGVALQSMLMPLIERIKTKRPYTMKAIQKINKFILHIGLVEGFITKPENIKPKHFFFNEAVFEDNLPKDRLVEIQEIQLEMKLGLEDREGAMRRLKKSDIQKRIKEIDKDREKYPEVYGLLTELEKQALEAGIKVKGDKSAGDLMKRDMGVNKAGNDSQVNAGFTNSPKPKTQTNS